MQSLHKPKISMSTGLLIASLLLLGLLSACAAKPPMNVIQAQQLPAVCEATLGKLEYLIHRHAVRDAQHQLVPGYPLLRTNRLLLALADTESSGSERDAWIQRASQLAIADYLIEFQNLPVSAVADLPALAELEALLNDCAWQQLGRLQQSEQWQRLVAVLQPGSEYFAGRRLLGLYPITNLAMKAGIREWQQDTRALFNRPAIDADMPLAVWAPNASQASNQPQPKWETDSLGWPVLSNQQWQTLASHYAPSWVVEQGGDYDLPGTPLAGAGFDKRDVVYWQPSVARVHGQLLPQISYVIWFAERPKTGAFDLLGGALDGVVFRVTFNRQGEELIYDSIHPCGCYHLFFPTSKLAHCSVDSSRESAFVPQAAPTKPFAVWLQSGTHYVQGLKPAPQAAAHHSYELQPLDQLRLKGDNPQRLYNPYGHVDGTERLERFLLWTSGLVSPGGMRQWGNHATAFSGERYFDEPDLFDAEFCVPEGP